MNFANLQMQLQNVWSLQNVIVMNACVVLKAFVMTLQIPYGDCEVLSAITE